MVFSLPAMTFSQEPAPCDFNYGSYLEHTPMPVTTYSPAIGLIGGKVYLTGGWAWADNENNHAWDYLQVYNLETDSWDTTGTRLPVPRAIYGGGDMALDGKLYVIGGIDWVDLGGGGWQLVPNARVDVYDPQSDTWELKANLPVPLGGKAVCSLNGKIYVSGGTSTDQVPINSLFCYDPSTDQWSELSSMETTRLFHMSVALDGKIYAIGGAITDSPNSSTKKCEVYDPDLDQWTSIASLPNSSVLGAACVVEGEIYVFGGGFTGNGTPQNRAYKYNPKTDTWTSIDDMEIPTKEHTVIPVDRTIFIFGASNNNYPFTRANQLSSIRVDSVIPDTSINGDAIVLDLSEHFSQVDDGEINYSVCLDDPAILVAAIDGSMLTLTGLAAGEGEVSILAESGEDQMGDAFQVNVTSPTSIDELCDIPASLQLYPNPSMGKTTLAYSVKTPGMIRIDICDILGKNVAVPFNEYRTAGEYEAQLNTGAFKPGIYFCRLHSSTGSITVKLMVEQ